MAGVIYSQNQNNSLSLGRIAPVLWQTTANVFVRDCGQGHAPVRNAPRSSIRPNLQPLSTSAPHRLCFMQPYTCSSFRPFLCSYSDSDSGSDSDSDSDSDSYSYSYSYSHFSP
uniref:HDC18883 n=1 Tax=Drosophila melanogaster TaxID=7227 RepID=Q6IIC8_DROME|nr:TPA_inf: HDC18883 [Drosophila melanogaster]